MLQDIGGEERVTFLIICTEILPGIDSVLVLPEVVRLPDVVSFPRVVSFPGVVTLPGVVALPGVAAFVSVNIEGLALFGVDIVIQPGWILKSLCYPARS